MTTKNTNIQPILFTRMNRVIENAIVLFVRTEFDAGYAFTLFRQAVSEWVKTTSNGRDLATYSSEDLNIGDLAAHDAFQDADLLEMMRAAGVEYVACHGIADDQCQDYDRVLMDRMPEIEEDSVPIDRDAIAVPIRLTDEYGQWIEGVTFCRNNVNLVPIFSDAFPERPATEDLQAGDPRDYFNSVLDLCYLAGYQHTETLGIMTELPVTCRKDISDEDFAALVAHKQSNLDRLQDQYPPFTFSVAHGGGSADARLVLRAFVPLDTDRDLLGCERFLLSTVLDELLLEALYGSETAQAVAA